ncbi:hypothetical protein L7F22_045199 [Adiantum nelumboides]|nr:hypothetical protein [Adiantum nelumboides]
MAEHLASIFGTEKDRVNCPFYFKIGACRHGDRCSRLHNKPTISPTLLFSNMYQRLDLATPGMDPRKVQEHFEDFYEDIFEELSKFGDLESLHVCDNLADHMVGNVYAQFREEEQAAAALQGLTGRFYAGRPIIVDFSPVTDFREATCRQFEENTCGRGGYCNFMHLMKIGRELKRKLFGTYGRHGASRSRSRSRSPQSFSPRRDYARRERYPIDMSYDSRGHSRSAHDYSDYDDWRSHSRGSSRGYSPSSRRRSPPRHRDRSPVREGSAERRAKIEQWNREREARQSGDYVNANGRY